MIRFNIRDVMILSVTFCIIHASQTYGQTQYLTSADNIQVAYETYGDGATALVFIHGWSCDRSYWHGQIVPFSRNFKVVAIDLPGHGESGLNRKSWTIEAFGADVADVVKKLNLQRVVLIGHSMGSNVVAEAARHLPGGVAGLILVDQYNDLGPGLTQDEVHAFAKKLQTNFKDSTGAFVRRMFLSTSDSALVDWVAEDMSSAPSAIALGALIFTLNYSRQMPHTLEELKLPVIAFNSDTSPTDVASLERYGVQAIVMQGVGHFLMMENPEGFNKLLVLALNRFAL